MLTYCDRGFSVCLLLPVGNNIIEAACADALQISAYNCVSRFLVALDVGEMSSKYGLDFS